MDEQVTTDYAIPAADVIDLLQSGTTSPAGARPSHQAGRALPPAERIGREIACVVRQSLSPALVRWTDAYNRVGQRNEYLWKWCRQGVKVTTLSCVPAGLRDEVCDTKVLGVMLDVLWDDVADQQGDPVFLDHLLRLPFGDGRPDHSQFSSKQQAYAQFTADVWSEVDRRIRRYPLFEDYVDLLQFDYQQLANVMRYSRLLNTRPALLNLAEHDLYLPHNMHMMVSATIDLMCSPDFDQTEIGRLREAVWYAQCMGRIGNLVTTWQRELGEGDFTSGVFAFAVSKGLLTVQNLQQEQRDLIETAIQTGKCEEHFLARWHDWREQLLAMQPRVRSVDLAELVDGLERLICLHLGSRGEK